MTFEERRKRADAIARKKDEATYRSRVADFKKVRPQQTSRAPSTPARSSSMQSAPQKAAFGVLPKGHNLKADVAAYNKQVEPPNFLERLGKIGTGGLGKFFGGTVNALNALDNTSVAKRADERMEDTFAKADSAIAEQIKQKLKDPNTSAEKRKELEDFLERVENNSKERIQRNTNFEGQMDTLGDNLMQFGQASTDRAKVGAGKVGKALIDAADAGVQLAGDIGAAYFTGGQVNPLTISAMRSGGTSAYQAKAEGKTDDEAALRGGLEFLKVYGLSKLSNVSGLAQKHSGKGLLDTFSNKVINGAADKLASTAAGKTAITQLGKLAVSGGGEGLEEMLETAFDPVLDAITYRDASELSDYKNQEYYSGMLYDGLIGGIVGGVAGGVDVATKTKGIYDNFKSDTPTMPLTPLNTNKNAPQSPVAPPTMDSGINTLPIQDIAQNATQGVVEPTGENSVDTSLPPIGVDVAMDGNKPKKSIPEMWKNFYTRGVDTQSAISGGLFTKGFSDIAHDNSGVLASNARNAGGTVNYIFTEGLVDMNGNQIGKSFKNVVEQIPQGQEQNFWRYMAQRHNIDRAREGKNVDPTYTPEMSQTYVQKAETENPNFKAAGDDVVNWIDTFERAWGVDSGLINDDVYNSLRETYKSYFPTQREFDDIETGLPREVTRQFVDPKNPLMTAKGSNRDLNNPVENIMSLVNRRVKSARYNSVGQEILRSVRKNPERLKQYAEIISPEEGTASKAENVVTVIENGERVYLRINDKQLLDSLKGLPKTTITIPVTSHLVTGFKNLITQKNPFFAVKNILRDVPTAYTYGSEGNPLKFGRDLHRAGKDVVGNTENYQRYKAMGGGMSNFFNSGKAESSAKKLTAKDNIAQKAIGVVENFNNLTETAPRLAEFNHVFKQTGDVQKALDASNNVTVNFARGGDVTKAIDRNFVPYLNAGVQGLDKLVRSFTTPRQAAKTLVRGGVCVLAPTMISAFINRDDEDYDELTNYVKDSYYCIPIGGGHNDGVVGNGKFFKLPKSRELGVLLSALPERIMRAANGEDEAFKDYGKDALISLAPSNPFENSIFSPAVRNLPSNKNFAGATIVPEYMKDRSKHLQYDEKTSELTKQIAQYAHKAGVEVSPKQMDYLIDAYTGVIADFLLPATTVGGDVGETIKRQFVSDPTFSNQSVSDFYEHYDEAKTAVEDKETIKGKTPDETTIEEKLKGVMQTASGNMSTLTQISLRAGVGRMTEDDKSTLAGHGIDPTLKTKELQSALRKRRIEIAKEANDLYKNSATDEVALDIYRKTQVGSFEYEDKSYTLTADEHTLFKNKANTLPKNIIKAAQKSRFYKQLSKSEKEALTSDAVNYAEDLAKRTIVNRRAGLGDAYKSSKYEKAYKADKAGISPADYFLFRNVLKNIDKNGNNNGSYSQLEYAQAIQRMELNQREKGKLWEIQNGDPSDKNPFTGRLAQRGIQPEKCIDIMESYNRIDKSLDDYVKVNGAPSAAYLRTSYFKQWLLGNGYNSAQAQDIMDVFKYWQMIPAKISRKSEAYVAYNPLW